MSFKSASNSSLSSSLSIKHLIVAVVLASVLFTIYKPLPEDFPQPWKYRLLCFGADFLSYIGDVLEYLKITHRVTLIRAAYYTTVGLFNIRSSSDNIEIVDEIINNVPIRVYKPLNSTRFNNLTNKMPLIIYYHGGGYFVGNADILEPVTYLLAKHTQCQVIYIEYRLIPDHPFPAALHDSLYTTRYLLKKHKKYNIDLENVVLIGDSAGGNLASVINRKLCEENIIKTKLKVLIYPILQFYDFTLGSYVENMPKRILGNIDRDNFKNFIHYLTGYEVDDTIFENGHLSSTDKESILNSYVNKNFIPNKYIFNHDVYANEFSNKIKSKNSTLNANIRKILLDVDVSPLLVDDIHLKEYNAQHVYVLSVGHDILRDDALIYVQRLKSINFLNVKHEHHDNLFHGIFGLLHGPLKFDLSHSLMDSVTKHINFVLDI